MRALKKARRMAVAILWLAGLSYLALVVAPAQAEPWPQRPVKFILPLGPGAGVDVTARLIADRLTKRWDQPVVVENRPGGDGVVAITAFISAQDDHTLLFSPAGSFTAHPYLHEKDSFTEIKVTRMASQRAYAMAGVGPTDIDCAEVHDCFTITEILDIEDLGFVDKGKGGVASLDGETSLTGRIPVNTSGGLLAKGHPIGATGVAQIVECWWQLRGEAADRQVETRNGYALQHNVGGRGSGVSVVNILTTNTA